jgi:hypothetical protein
MAAIRRGWCGAALAVLLSGHAWAESGDTFDFLDAVDLPPVNLTGALTYTYTQNRPATGIISSQSVATATITPSTYLIEPWLATMNGNINVSRTSSDEQQANIMTGSLMVAALPQSDYPTTLTYTRFNRNVQAELTENALTGQSAQVLSRVALPWDITVQTRVQLDESGDDKGQSQNSSEANFDINKLIDGDVVRLNINHREAMYSDATGTNGGTSVADSATVRYRTEPIEGMTADSVSTARTATVSDSTSTETSTIMQGVTTAVYRPKFLDDVTINGALRTFSENTKVARIGTGGTETRQSQTAYGNLASSYVFAPRLIGSMGANLGLTQTKTTSSTQSASGTPTANTANANAGLTGMTYGTNANLSYSSEGEDFQGFTWSWSAGNSVDISGGNAGAMVFSDSLNLSHSLYRIVDFPLIGKFNVSGSEGAGSGMSSDGGGLNMPISHSLTMSKNIRDGKQWSILHFNASDSRTLGTTSSVFQLGNAQMSSGLDIDRFSSISINFNYQLSRQMSGTTDNGFRDSANGQISYRERTLLGIENLNFSAELSVNPPSMLDQQRSQDLARSASTVNDSKPKETSFGSQRLSLRFDYAIGQFRTNLTARATKDDQGLSQAIMGQVTRRF